MKQKTTCILGVLFIRMVFILNPAIAQSASFSDNRSTVYNPHILLEHIDQNAVISLTAVADSELEKDGIVYYDYQLEYISSGFQSSRFFVFSEDRKRLIPAKPDVSEKSIPGISKFKIGFNKTTTFNSIRVYRGQFEKTTTLTAFLSAYFQGVSDKSDFIFIASDNLTKFSGKKNDSHAAVGKTAIFHVSDLDNLYNLPLEIRYSDAYCFVLENKISNIPIRIADAEKRLLHSIVLIDAHESFKTKMTFATHGLCNRNHQSFSFVPTNSIIPVYLSCPPQSSRQVNLDIVQLYPLSFSNPDKEDNAHSNVLSFDLFEHRFIRLKGKITTDYGLIYIDLSNQFIKKKTLDVVERIIDSLEQSNSNYSLFASNHLNPLVLHSADISKQTKNEYFMRLLSLAPDPPGIYKETQLLKENCLKTYKFLLDPLDLFFVFSGGSASFNLNLINSVVRDLPYAATVRCKIYVPASQTGEYNSKQLLRYRHLDRVKIEFQHFN